MSVAGVLARARKAAEATMLDEVVIRRQTGTTTDADDNVVPAWQQVYVGPCKLQAREVDAATPNAGEAAVIVLRLRLDLPADTLGVLAGDVGTMTACEFDDEVIGRTFRIAAPFHASFKSARRFPVEEVAS